MTKKIFEPLTGLENWQVITKLAARLGAPFPYTSVKEIADEIRSAVAGYREMNGEAFWGRSLLEKAFMTPNGKAKFNPLAIDLSACNFDKKEYVSSENCFRPNIKQRLLG